MSEKDWRFSPIHLTVDDDEVHLWRTWLDRPYSQMPYLTEILSEDEQARAGRIKIDKAKRHFVAGRGMLRDILSRYLRLKPAAVAFEYGPQAKPRPAAGSVDLRFNVTHSHGLMLVAITRAREIGVDVEKLRPMPDAGRIAERFFSAVEKTALQAAPSGQTTEAFFACWTRKEAYLKAVGDGITRPLDSFDVSLTPGQPAQLLRVADDPAEVDRWSLRSFTPMPGFIAALAVEGHNWRLRHWQWMR